VLIQPKNKKQRKIIASAVLFILLGHFFTFKWAIARGVLAITTEAQLQGM
jgi:hypothetical protein